MHCLDRLAPSWDGGERGDLRDAHVADRWAGSARAAASAPAGAPSIAGRASAGSAKTGLDYVCTRLNVSTGGRVGCRDVSTRCLSTTPRAPRVLHVCDDIACRCKGGDRAHWRNRKSPSGRHMRTGRRADHVEIAADAAVWMRSPCLGLCDHAPAAFSAGVGKSRRERC